MSHLKLAEARTTQTPAATMQTYTSPTTEVPSPLALWRTEMAAGTAGPTHTVDTDHVVVVLAGRLLAEVDGEHHTVEPGDAVTLPAGSSRRLASGPDAALVTLTVAEPGSAAQVAGSEPVPIPWAR